MSCLQLDVDRKINCVTRTAVQVIEKRVPHPAHDWKLLIGNFQYYLCTVCSLPWIERYTALLEPQFRLLKKECQKSATSCSFSFFGLKVLPVYCLQLAVDRKIQCVTRTAVQVIELDAIFSFSIDRSKCFSSLNFFAYSTPFNFA